VAAVVEFTSAKPLDATDRHFGYEAAYLTGQSKPSTPCNPTNASALPIVTDTRSFLPPAAIDPNTGPNDRQFFWQPYYFDIGAVKMWGRGLTGSQPNRPVTVAVIDTGVDLDHPDLQPNIVQGYDFVDDDNIPDDTSAASHGTMVAGVIAARMNNDTGSAAPKTVAGIGGGDALAGTPGLRIMPLRVAANDDDIIPCERVAQAIDYAIDHGAQVINMSFRHEERCPPPQEQQEFNALRRAYAAGIALVAGAGNDSSNLPVYPAAYDGAETGQPNGRLVLAVAGVYLTGVKALKSNYGDWVDVSAPYRRIRTTTRDGGYGSDDGTSFSAAFVSGLIGVLMSNKGWSRDQAITAVLWAADNLDAANPNLAGKLGAGRINADRASTLIIRQVYLPSVRR
jgi:thermitase